jgi:hypothetical protein
VILTTRTVEKISVVVVVAVLGAALAVNVGGAPVALLIVALAITVSAGMDLVLRGEARYHPTPDLFILPVALVVGGVLFISLLATGIAIVIALAALGTLLFAVFWAEFSCLQPRPARSVGGLEDEAGEAAKEAALLPPRNRPSAPERRGAEIALAVIGYVSAFVLYTAVYQSKTRSLFSAPAIIAISFMLAARQLRLAHEPAKPNAEAEDDETAPADNPDAPNWPRTLIYSAAVALAAGEVTWALNYWPLNGLMGGAFLLAVFYFLIGMFSQHLQRRLTGRLVLEYGLVSAVGMVLITAAGLLHRGA